MWQCETDERARCDSPGSFAGDAGAGWRQLRFIRHTFLMMNRGLDRLWNESRGFLGNWLNGYFTTCSGKWQGNTPVRRIFLSRCLGVSDSSYSSDAGPGVLPCFSLSETFLLVVADFLVMLCKILVRLPLVRFIFLTIMRNTIQTYVLHEVTFLLVNLLIGSNNQVVMWDSFN